MEIQTHLNLFSFCHFKVALFNIFCAGTAMVAHKRKPCASWHTIFSPILIQTFIQLFLCFEADAGLKALWVHYLMCGL